ncbi:TIGR02680 family protein [Amycolatopsis sp. H20-H5]|uniref:TIGR02680 family protein n=1 Tax=Amycolatopsis sp. H20-H5 TaxID=3046309 RepID=UPI002DBE8FEE|nr:TIGR02680 family protein [Amycolatopsis sp. H20-H5]MEC3977965.1 TIGR02680 family protein [Amycolatopsis sp. H20-H5]
MTITELPRAATIEPSAGTPRWTPTRAGILNVWRYYDEVFEFHKGRLLLHGPNGTGKSKALELLLPFLFDANLRANRLSTFGTGERTMHWNLMGEGATGTTRVGYVWLEFNRGNDSWFTCGARLQATAHTKTVHVDYFTSERRVGLPAGLKIVTDSGQPLTKAALQDELGELGAVHDTSADYRAAVRATLFPGLTEQRYDALITALLQLRMPKLSQRLDPALLSTLLSRALPPLGEGEIAELAEGFERLDRQREQLKVLDAEAEAARRLATQQRGYAQRVLRASAGTLVSATSELTRLTRTARESEDAYKEAVLKHEEAAKLAEELETRSEQLGARIEGLKDSDEYKQGRELDKLREQARAAQAAATLKRQVAEAKRRVAEADAQQAEIAADLAVQGEKAESEAGADAARAAERARLGGVSEEMAANPQTGRKLLRAAVRSRQEQIDVVRAAVGAHESSIDRRHAAEDALEQVRADLAEAMGKRDELAKAYTDVVREQVRKLREWAGSCVELAFPDADALAECAESEPSVLEFVDTVAALVLQEITVEQTTVAAERAAANEALAVLVDERRQLREDVDLPPVAPVGRTTDRSTMDGAPFWKLVSFVDGVSAWQQAGVEAALQASGLLDAWVPSHGAIEVVGHDTFIETDFPAVTGSESLASVLRPEPGGAVPVELVARLLAGIAYGETVPGRHSAAIGADGRWRLANASGSWDKGEVSYIGTVAREQARQRRLAELTAKIGELGAVIAEFDSRLVVLAGRRTKLAAERSGRPGHAPLEAASTALNHADSRVSAADRAVARVVEQLAACEQAVRTAVKELTFTASENGLPAERDGLDALAEAVGVFRDVADNWLDVHAKMVAVKDKSAERAEQARRSAEAAEESAEDALTAERDAGGLAEKLEAIDSTIGVDYQEVLAEVGRLRDEAADVKLRTKDVAKELHQLATRLGSLDTQRSIDEDTRKAAVDARDGAASRFRHLASGSFPVDAGLELEAGESTRASLEGARAVAAKWPNLPHGSKNLGDALHRLTEEVYSSREILSDRADLELETDGDVGVFSAAVNGMRVGASELLDILRAEAERSRGDITGAERELFDQTLTGDTRRHLAARIRQAGALVDAMNERLEQVRTASNVAVRLVWQVRDDLPTGTKAARELLLKDPVRLSDADRESLHRFFRDRIEEAKADDTATSWEQQLAQVFDYTSWHQFVVKIDRANGAGWQLLTKKLHGALSGGEKAIALHLPLFAAVAAHYQAVQEGPRIILLDEVFVGVDTANRGQIFGLLASLDLDLLLTSDHEWCDYQELPGIAIHKLITGGDGDDAVTTVRFVWDGADLLPDDA